MSELIEGLRRTKSLPSPPGVALEIIRINQDEEVSIADLSAVISRDPAIAAKVLRAANSSHMGRPGQVADIEDAIMVLGIRSVNLLALSFSLSSGMASSRSKSFDHARFWSQSAVATLAARSLAAKHLKASKDEAFLAGLLCDFGQLLLAEALPDDYGEVMERQAQAGGPLHELERSMLGCDHAQAAAEVLAGWGLPEIITGAIAAHHDPSRVDAREHQRMRLAQVLHLASTCGALYVGDNADEADDLIAQAEGYFGMSTDDCQELIDDLREGVPELLEILDFKSVDPVEVARIRDRANELLVRESLQLDLRVQAISNTVERLTEQNLKLERRARTDALTGLHNRVYLEEVLEQELKRAARSNSGVGVLIMDVDEFKKVNDFYGHLAGDSVLKELGALIESRLGFGQSAIRCGGDEFIVLCTDATLEALLERARRLRQSVEETPITWQDSEIRITLSIGGALVQGAAAAGAFTDLLHHADGELYKAKRKGRNRVFVSALRDEAESRS